MKLFQRLLAVTLVAVLALTVFTACGDASELPSSTTEQRIMQDLNDGAQEYKEAVLSPLYYSSDLSSYTASKLNVYLRYINGDIKKDEYDAEIEKLEQECKAKYNYVVAQQDEKDCSLIKASTPTKTDYKSELYSKSDAYMAASKVGIARIENKTANGGDGKTYTMVECYKSVK